MFPIVRRYAVLLTAVALVSVFSADFARAQPPRGRARLAALQQQNALLQQQNALQAAAQQTTSLLQSAYRQSNTPQLEMLQTSGMLQARSMPNRLNFQQQQNALQIALQQTTSLLQVSFRQNSALSQAALRQLNTLQTALQTTTAIQGALPTQNGQLTDFQLQSLSQEQASLLGLLTTQPPPMLQGRSPR